VDPLEQRPHFGGAYRVLEGLILLEKPTLLLAEGRLYLFARALQTGEGVAAQDVMPDTLTMSMLRIAKAGPHEALAVRIRLSGMDVDAERCPARRPNCTAIRQDAFPIGDERRCQRLVRLQHQGAVHQVLVRFVDPFHGSALRKDAPVVCDGSGDHLYA